MNVRRCPGHGERLLALSGDHDTGVTKQSDATKWLLLVYNMLSNVVLFVELGKFNYSAEWREQKKLFLGSCFGFWVNLVFARGSIAQPVE